MELSPSEVYLGNPRLKKANVQLDYTKEQVEELVKCRNDIHYFCNTYMKIVNVDRGMMNFETYDFQDNIISGRLILTFVIALSLNKYVLDSSYELNSK